MAESVKCQWNFLGRDSSILQQVHVVLLSEKNNEALLEFDIHIEELLSLLNGNNRANYAPIDLDTTDRILNDLFIEYGNKIQLHPIHANIFEDRELVITLQE